MAGYTRQDTANNIANGNVIDADDFDAEYNAVEAAFNASTGHKHDGTAGEGAPIEKVGPSQDLVVSATKVEAKTTNTLDLGSSGVQFKDGFFDGTLNTDVLSVDETSTFTGAVTASSTLDVTGATGIDGDFDINTDKFTVASASGNTAIAGTLAVTGASTLTGDVTAYGAMNITGNTGVDGNFDVATDKFTVASTTGNTAVAGTLAVTGTSAFTGAITATGGVTGDLVGNADTATTWETAREIALTGDVTGTVTGVDGSGNISIATTVAADSVALGTDTTGNYMVDVDGGTGVTVTHTEAEGSTATIAIGQAVETDSNVTFNNMTLAGNLTVNGTTTTAASTNTVISDTLIELGNGTSGTPANDSGIVIERGSQNNAFIGFDESADKFKVGTGTFTGSSTGNLTITTGTLVADIEGDVTGNVTGDVTGDLTGNADTATTLATARTIAGQSFDGSANINIAPTDLTGVTASATEINKLDGFTGSTADLNNLVATGGVPTGLIAMWSGTVANIPTGWNLCDGTNGTPNLVDRFIVGSASDSGQTHDIGDTGGANSLTLTEANIPAHTHSFSGTTNTTGDHYHLDGTVVDVTAEATYGTTQDTSATRVAQSQVETKDYHAHTSTEGDHSHTFSGTTGSTGSGSSFDNRPAYYALAFIMKA